MTQAKARMDEDVTEAGGTSADVARAASDAPFVQLSSFEGPLDLLLHLIQKHELDILDIPVSFITEKYLEYLDRMRTLSIDVASEYLVMAATLAHIKSKMLLPSVPAGQDEDGNPIEEEDPRAELVRRLLEYQKYKAAAEELGGRSTLGRDVFGRGSAEPVPEGPAPFAPVSVFSLLDAFDRVLKRARVRVDHEVVFDRISITDRIVQLTEVLGQRRAMSFEDLLLCRMTAAAGEPVEPRPPTRFELVVTFLALLEMARLKLVRIYQTDALAPIHVELRGDGTNEASSAVSEEAGVGGEGGAAPPRQAEADAPMGGGEHPEEGGRHDEVLDDE